MTQAEASLARWSPGTPIHDELVIEVAGRDARRYVREGILTVVPWLRLPGVAQKRDDRGRFA